MYREREEHRHSERQIPLNIHYYKNPLQIEIYTTGNETEIKAFS